MLPDDPGTRVSDHERERVAELLNDHRAAGRLTAEEFDERIGRALAAKTAGELAPLLADLPRTESRRVRRRRRSKLLRAHAGTWVLVNGFLTGVWAVTTPSDYFWPVWPMMGTGLGLGSHVLAHLMRSEGHAESHRRREEWYRQHGMIALAEFHRQVRRMRQRQRRELERGERRGEHRHHTPRTPALDTVPPQPYVAIVFTDIAGSTSLTEALGDEEWHRLRARHHQLLEECFRAFGGEIAGTQGDGCLARFASPAAAVDAAVEVQRRLEDVRASVGFAPHVRIGVHAGQVIDDAGDLVGRVVNVASRVTGVAEPDEIWVTEQVAEVVPTPCDDRGLHELRGVAQPRHLLAVRWREDTT